MYKMCRSHRRLCALFEHSAHENRGTSQVLYTPMMKLPTVSGFLHSVCASFTKTAERRRQAFCTPMMKLLTVSGFLHSPCTPLTKTAESQAFCTPMKKLLTVSGLKLRNVSGFLHRHDEIPDSLTLRIRLCTPHKECADSPRPRALHPRKWRRLRLPAPPRRNRREFEAFCTLSALHS